MMTLKYHDIDLDTAITTEPRHHATAGKVNKSGLIREAMEVLGEQAPLKQIVSHVKAAYGVDVTPSLVGVTRSKVKHKAKANATALVAPSADATLDRLFEIKAFADRLGGLSVLKDGLAHLERLAA